MDRLFIDSLRRVLTTYSLNGGELHSDLLELMREVSVNRVTEGMLNARIVTQQTAIAVNLNELRDRVETLAVKANGGRRVDSVEVQELLTITGMLLRSTSAQEATEVAMDVVRSERVR